VYFITERKKPWVTVLQRKMNARPLYLEMETSLDGVIVLTV